MNELVRGSTVSEMFCSSQSTVTPAAENTCVHRMHQFTTPLPTCPAQMPQVCRAAVQFAVFRVGDTYAALYAVCMTLL